MAFAQQLNNKLREFISLQSVFFAATAPLEGRINLSPKGMDTFRCIDESRVAYLDLTGSGNETAAHIHQNGRLTIMFCSFSAKPLILRLYGKGEVINKNSEKWDGLITLFRREPGERQIIMLNIESVQTSCGYGVPVFELTGERKTLRDWAERKDEVELEEYRRRKNSASIDGLPTHLLEN